MGLGSVGPLKTSEPTVSTDKVELGPSRRGPTTAERVGTVKLGEVSLRLESHLYQTQETQILDGCASRLTNDKERISDHRRPYGPKQGTIKGFNRDKHKDESDSVSWVCPK